MQYQQDVNDKENKVTNYIEKNSKFKKHLKIKHFLINPQNNPSPPPLAMKPIINGPQKEENRKARFYILRTTKGKNGLYMIDMSVRFSRRVRVHLS